MTRICKRCDVVLETKISRQIGLCFYHRNKSRIDALRKLKSVWGLQELKKIMTPKEYEFFIKQNIRNNINDRQRSYR